MFQAYLNQYKTEKKEAQAKIEERQERKKKESTKRTDTAPKKKLFRALLDQGKPIKEACSGAGILIRTGRTWIDEGRV